MHYINPDNWKRKKHFEFFKKYKHPHFNICSNIEITDAFKFIRRNKISFFPAILFAVMKTCNHFEEFRQRIQDDKIAVYEIVHPGITLLAKEDIYTNCIIDYKEIFSDFLSEYEIVIKDAKKEIIVGEKQGRREDLIYISCLPWLSFTSVTNPMDGNPLDSIPRIIWGKQIKQDTKTMMPLSVQVNHCLMDGIHVAKFFYKVSELLREPEKLFL